MRAHQWVARSGAPREFASWLQTHRLGRGVPVTVIVIVTGNGNDNDTSYVDGLIALLYYGQVAVPPPSRVQLFSARGKRDFYERLGFVARPDDGPGMELSGRP
jgi:hypothetical protein